MCVNVDHQVVHDPISQTKIILSLLSEAEPDGIDKDEFRKLAEMKGIDAADLNDLLAPLLSYANIYLNTSKGRYHYMWSSSVQYE